jgi:hypothetical protein
LLVAASFGSDGCQLSLLLVCFARWTTMPAKKTPKKEVAPAAAKPAAKKARAKEEQNLKRFNIDFLAEVSSLCQLPTNDVRKVLEGLRKVLLNQIREKKTARVPNVVMLRIKTLKARPAMKKVLFGAETELRARPETKKVMCTVLKSFKTDSRAS